MFWHTSVQYYTIIDPVKQRERMARLYYNPKYDRESQYYQDRYGNDPHNGAYYGGHGRYRPYVPHERTRYGDTVDVDLRKDQQNNPKSAEKVNVELTKA